MDLAAMQKSTGEVACDDRRLNCSQKPDWKMTFEPFHASGRSMMGPELLSRLESRSTKEIHLNAF